VDRAQPRRCSWAGGHPLLTEYHDAEWGVPVADDRRLFELLCLEGAQAGLSWLTILRKREGYRKAFAGFDPDAVARFPPAKVEKLLRDPGIVRNRQKIEAVIANARALRALRKEFGSLRGYLSSVLGEKPRRNRWSSPSEVPAETRESRDLSRALRQRGFRFVGPTTCYSFMQAVGLVNDHLVGCFRHRGIPGR
jgi:DNA-3-methyladenine glycosylase I